MHSDAMLIDALLEKTSVTVVFEHCQLKIDTLSISFLNFSMHLVIWTDIHITNPYEKINIHWQ